MIPLFIDYSSISAFIYTLPSLPPRDHNRAIKNKTGDKE
jgi:hypothetical protein